MTSPASDAANPAYLLQLSDLHLRNDASAQMNGTGIRDSLRAVLAQCETDCPHPPDLVAVTGDIVDDETPAGYRTTYQWLVDTLQPIADTLYLPGNHDDARILRAVTGDSPWQSITVRKLKSWLLVALDSCLESQPGGRISEPQLAALHRILEENRRSPVVVLLHHPLIDLGSRWMDSMKVDNAAAVLAVLAGHPSPVTVLSGHAHQCFDRRMKNLRLLGAPATCPRQFMPGSDDFAEQAIAPGARWVALSAGDILDTQVLRVA